MRDSIRCGVVQTATSNLGAINEALNRLGVTPFAVTTAESVLQSELLVLPGVGTLAEAMRCLQNLRLVDALRARVAARKPLLAICLGMQMLFDESEESPGVPGLGCFPGKVRRFSDRVMRPQLGWNFVSASSRTRFVTNGYAYFANSYRVPASECALPKEFNLGTAEHDGNFLAYLESGPILATQFHPELSGNWGMEILTRWCNQGGEPC